MELREVGNKLWGLNSECKAKQMLMQLWDVFGVRVDENKHKCAINRYRMIKQSDERKNAFLIKESRGKWT